MRSVVTNWSPVGLASLRSKMAVAIIDRDHRNPANEDEVYRTAAEKFLAVAQTIAALKTVGHGGAALKPQVVEDGWEEF